MRIKLPGMKKLNNEGTTLIELLIVIAIIAVLISGIIIGFTVLNSSNLKQATRYTSTYLSKTKTNTMSMVADEWYFELTKNSTDYVVRVYKTYSEPKLDGDGNEVMDAAGNVIMEPKTDLIEEKELGSKFTAKLVDGTNKYTLDANNKLKVTFVPSSGAVKKVVVTNASGDILKDDCGATKNMVSIEFNIKSKTADVELYFVSGKTEVND